MSIQAVAWALDFSESTRTARLVMLSLANHADKYGERIFPAVATIAEEAKCSERAVQYALRELVEIGELVQTGTTKTGTNVWKIDMSGGANSAGANFAGVQTATDRGAGPAPKPSEGTVIDGAKAPSLEGARERAAVKISGKPVQPTLWTLTEQVLTEFNRQTGRHLRSMTSGGQPSEAAKRIYGRVVHYADLGFGDYERIIRNTLASRWWGEDKPSVGVVFGPKVFEENISRSPVKLVTSRRAEKDSELERQHANVQSLYESGALSGLFGSTA